MTIVLIPITHESGLMLQPGHTKENLPPWVPPDAALFALIGAHGPLAFSLLWLVALQLAHVPAGLQSSFMDLERLALR